MSSSLALEKQSSLPLPEESLRTFFWGPIPLGWLFSVRTFCKNPPKQMEQLQTTLETEGLTVLDAHFSSTDILASTVAMIYGVHPATVRGPVAASHYYHPLYGRSLLEKLNQLPNVATYPVFRREEKKHGDRSGLTAEEKRKKNDEYLQVVQRELGTANSMSIIAPFGSRRAFGHEIRHGVLELLQTEAPFVCTASLFDWKSMAYWTRISDVLRFNPKHSEPQIRSTLTETFTQLRLPTR